MSVLPSLRRLSDHINQAAIVLCIGCILSMLGISFTAFLYKLFTGSTLSWTYSLARLFLPWIGFLSMTISLRYGEHVAMTLLVRSLPKIMVKIAAVMCLVSSAYLHSCLRGMAGATSPTRRKSTWCRIKSVFLAK